VAYADFVTAMMALFIVLWLLNSSKQVQEAVEDTSRIVGQFQDGWQHDAGLGAKPGSSKRRHEEDQGGTAEANQGTPDFEKIKKHVDMTITAKVCESN